MPNLEDIIKKQEKEDRKNLKNAILDLASELRQKKEEQKSLLERSLLESEDIKEGINEFVEGQNQAVEKLDEIKDKLDKIATPEIDFVNIQKPEWWSFDFNNLLKTVKDSFLGITKHIFKVKLEKGEKDNRQYVIPIDEMGNVIRPSEFGGTGKGRTLIKGGGPPDYGEDTPHTSGDRGILPLAVRNDAGTALAANGDYIPLTTDSTGALRTLATVSLTIKSEQADDAAFTPAQGTVIMIGAEFDDVTPDLVDEGDGGAVRMSANRNLYIRVRDDAGNERGLNVDANGEIGIGAIRTSVTPGTAAANLGKAEDAAHVSGDTGVLSLAVRRDTAAASSGTDGDYEPLSTDNTGRLRIAAAPANSGVDIGDVDILSVIPGTGATSLGKAEDAVAASGDTGVVPLAIRKDTATNLVSADGDYAAQEVNARGATWVAIENGSGGQVTSFGGGTQFAEDAAHVSGDVGTMALAVSNEANTVRAADGDYIPIATDTEGNTKNVGNRDHDAVDAGEPVKVGGQARTTNPTAVADADRVNFIADDLGRQVVIPIQVRDLVVQQTTTLSSTTETTILTAGAAGVFHDLTLLIVSNTSATDVRVDFRDATGGAVRFSLNAKLKQQNGFVVQVPVTQTTAANNWTAQLSAAVTDVRVFVQAVKNI